MTDDDLFLDDPDELTRAEAHRRRVLRGLGAAFVVVLAIIVAVQWTTDDPDDPELPAATLTTIDGAPFELRSVIGKPTVINFFASWCLPCLDELPDFEAVHRAVGDDVAFYGVNSRETDVEQALDLIDQTGVTFPVLLGEDGSVVQAVGSTLMPTTIFLAADGSIAEVAIAAMDADTLAAKIDEHFG